jgi:hypothetical protein
MDIWEKKESIYI